MAEPPFFSILVPTYNRSAMLQEALESIVAQTTLPDDVEVVIANDNSCDDTAAVMESFRGRLPNLRLFHHPANLGGPGNWAFLLEQSRGEFVFLLSDDDALAPTFLATYLGLLRKEPDLDLMFSGMELRGSAMEYLEDLPLTHLHGFADGAARVREQLFAHHMVMTAAYRRRVLVAAGGWNGEVGTHLDSLAFCRAALRSRRTYYHPATGLRYRITPGSWASFSVEKQQKLNGWYRRLLDLVVQDAQEIAPGLLPFLSGMYVWHAKSMLHALEVELAYRRISGGEARDGMRALLRTFPEAAGSRAALKLRIASHVGTGWLRLLRRVLGKPDPYQSPLRHFGGRAPASSVRGAGKDDGVRA